MSALKQRIADLEVLIPYGLERMLSLLDIVETDTVPTAAIPIGASSPRILINPEFVQEHCQEDICLGALILHELHHLLLGHTRVFPRTTTLHNIAFDAIINAMICRQEPKYKLFFQKYYPETKFPECLLRPPECFPKPYVPHPDIPSDVQKIIKELYYTNRTSFYDVFELICRYTTIIQLEHTLIGNHGTDGRGFEKHDDPALFEAIRAIVEEWPLPPFPIKGRSLADTFMRKSFTYEERKTPEKTIVQAIMRLKPDQGENQGVGQGYIDKQTQQIWPNFRDRKTFAMMQTGIQPLLFQGKTPHRETLTPVSIYVDVSGSMNPYISHVSNAVISCSQYLNEDIFLFSTKISSIHINEFQKGSYNTTSGTDITAVAKHIHENKVKTAVILTDGFVGPVPKQYLKACRNAAIQVILTEDGYKDDLIPIANEIYTLGAPNENHR
ncbi:MAG: hypothetical protein CL916_13380 [Deltaproteobacteria bacterium]|nr:hypothetical protein [Deltaproteobacteria bacterium]